MSNSNHKFCGLWHDRVFTNKTFENISVNAIINNKFSHCTFINASIFSIIDCKFNHCTFIDADFHKGEFDNCRFTSCKFINSNFKKTEITDAIFKSSTFNKSEFLETDLTNCKLHDTNFMGENMDVLTMFISNSTFLNNEKCSHIQSHADLTSEAFEKILFNFT